MTDRAVGVLVTLTEPMRTDDVEEIMSLLRLVKGVADVRLVKSESGLADIGVRMQERQAIRERLVGLIRELDG